MRRQVCQERILGSSMTRIDICGNDKNLLLESGLSKNLIIISDSAAGAAAIYERSNQQK
jgi:hypothetical protein